MRPYFVANSTRGIAVVVYVHGGSTPVSTTNAGVAAGSSLCKAVTGGRQCTISVSAPTGSDDFVIKTYDTVPSSGGFSGAKQLAVGSATKTIAAGKANSLNVTVGGVVAKAAVHLSWPVNPVIDKDTQTVTVSALDADGNTIINDGWYSDSGSAVTMALSASNGSTGMFAFAPASVGFASPTSKLTFDSTKITSTQAQNGFTSTIAATPSDGGTVGSAIFTLSKPAFKEWTITTATSYPEGIVVGPDNAIWFAENIGNAIGRITTNAAAGTHPAEYSSGMTASAGPVALAVAPDDHKIWFTENEIGNVASIDPSTHAITEYGTPSGSGDLTYGITAGSDGNMWFTEECTLHSNIGKFNANAEDGGVGVIHEYATNASMSGPAWIAAGPDNKLWFTETAVDKIGTITTAGTGANDFALASNSVGDGRITSGPDGALWFSEENPNSGHSIQRITTGGSITSEHSFSNTFTSAMGIVTGPDGALWFVENGNNAIGRIDPTTKTVFEFSLPNASSNPWGIVKGPDGALWFTECLGDRIGKLQ
ncbi:MAG TPA: hypothetical protein VFE36_13500 [Candidatus Baltobacteraceae bacterium]|nr:hypothetical protein [Candidatus Baltobacteraceae bacterium]